MTEEELKQRFKSFSLRIIKLVDHLPRTISSIAIAKQLIRSGTSPAANYRAACIAKSDKDFINKLKIVEEELDETTYWLDLIIEAEIMPRHLVEPLKTETTELLMIIVKSIKTLRIRDNSTGEFLVE